MFPIIMTTRTEMISYPNVGSGPCIEAIKSPDPNSMAFYIITRGRRVHLRYYVEENGGARMPFGGK